MTPAPQANEFRSQASRPNRDLMLPSLVARWARELPSATALVEEDYSLTYLELDRRSTVLGAKLRSIGVSRDSLVALCLPRSIAFLVAVLGIWKAGAAYLPLEPSDPKQRLEFLLSDSQASLLITNPRISKKQALLADRILLLEKNAVNFASASENDSAMDIAPDDLAYVIYTSGSTGRPKGVEITHRGLTNLIVWHRANFQLTPSDCASHLASVVFDAAVWEVWPYLASGACIHIGDDWLVKDPARLRDWLLDHSITCSFVPTRIAERLMCFEWPPSPHLRLLLTGGEHLHRYPPRELPFHVVNNYGPTECTVVATSGIVDCNEIPDLPPPIGRPIANTEIYLLDEILKPVEKGKEGEIWIAGPGIARGYRGRPDLTAEKFRANPFDPSFGPRMYRTGDVGLALPDGQIAFIGRADTQVKIRGHRTELEEIELCLSRHPSVLETAVVACPLPSGELSLVGFVVKQAGSRMSVEDLRTFLKTVLPEPLIPSLFLFVEQLPVLMSGKLDRAALRNAASGRLAATPNHKPFVLRDEIDKGLQQICQALLKCSSVPLQADFFLELGADSLQAVQLFTEIEKVFGQKLSISSLLEKRTLAGLAQELRERITGDRGSALVPLRSQGVQPPVFCIHSHDGEFLFCRHLTEFAYSSRPVYAFRAPALAGGSIHFTVEETANAYLAELLRIQPEGSYHLFGFCYGGYVAFEMALRLIEKGWPVPFLGMFNTPPPGTLTGWPLTQLSYLGHRIETELRKMASLPMVEKANHLYHSAHNFYRMLASNFKIDLWRLTTLGMGDRFAQRLGRRILDLEQIHIAAGKRYRPQQVLDGRISYFVSEQLPYPYVHSPEEGWQKFAARGVKIVRVLTQQGNPFRSLMGAVAEQIENSTAGSSVR